MNQPVWPWKILIFSGKYHQNTINMMRCNKHFGSQLPSRLEDQDPQRQIPLSELIVALLEKWGGAVLYLDIYIGNHSSIYV